MLVLDIGRDATRSNSCDDACEWPSTYDNEIATVYLVEAAGYSLLLRSEEPIAMKEHLASHYRRPRAASSTICSMVF